MDYYNFKGMNGRIMKAERKLMMHWQNEKYLTESQNEINLNIGIGSKNMEDEWKYSPSLL